MIQTAEVCGPGGTPVSWLRSLQSPRNASWFDRLCRTDSAATSSCSRSAQTAASCSTSPLSSVSAPRSPWSSAGDSAGCEPCRESP